MREVGEAVTPAGSPVKATLTEPVKEFSAVARTLSWEPVWPAVRFSEVGDAVREKSGVGGGSATVVVTETECVNVPEVPVSVILTEPAAAVEAAVKVTFCAAPGVRLRDAGEAVTPAGSPEKATLTEPVNEFTAVARTLTWEPVWPAVRFSEAGEAASEKSGAGGGGAEIVAVTVAK
jgi:hypothetical protein